MMSEASVPHAEHKEPGPNYFGYHMREIVGFLSQNEEFLSPFSSQTHDLSAMCAKPKAEGIRDDCGIESKKIATSSSLFADGIGAGLPDFKRERLKASLKESVLLLNQEVDEVDDDLRVILEFGGLEVEETIKKYSDELFAKLGHMEQQLEELLDIVMSKSRSMTITEKQKLRKLIQELPSKNLDRIVEIILRKRPPDCQPCDEVYIDLETEDNVTLWRLYYYVEAVASAKKLASWFCQTKESPCHVEGITAPILKPHECLP
ncbi:uncharacterized protein LOC122076725 isoform X4 [Macadamia integrifolia]|uniref:uncharacterized protein LOC122076725 isoform X4 n=1 Tax=Macadamia integrifolia TaxID=60698 RepID=UPI001C4F3678|nr:uncharacterized protein LOC122076725 isoform X4 [Macadamia integrifolia]